MAGTGVAAGLGEYEEGLGLSGAGVTTGPGESEGDVGPPAC